MTETKYESRESIAKVYWEDYIASCHMNKPFTGLEMPHEINFNSVSSDVCSTIDISRNLYS